MYRNHRSCLLKTCRPCCKHRGLFGHRSRIERPRDRYRLTTYRRQPRMFDRETTYSCSTSDCRDRRSDRAMDVAHCYHLARNRNPNLRQRRCDPLAVAAAAVAAAAADAPSDHC